MTTKLDIDIEWVVYIDFGNSVNGHELVNQLCSLVKHHHQEPKFRGHLLYHPYRLP
jgi:hypothetical protein